VRKRGKCEELRQDLEAGDPFVTGTSEQPADGKEKLPIKTQKKRD